MARTKSTAGSKTKTSTKLNNEQPGNGAELQNPVETTDVKPASSPATQAETASQAKANGGVKSAPETKLETKSEPKPESKSEPKPESKSEPKPESKSELKPETKSETKPETKSEPRKIEAKAEPRKNVVPINQPSNSQVSSIPSASIFSTGSHSNGQTAAQKNQASLHHSNTNNANLEEEIRHRAYQLYVERGSIPGNEAEDWLRAEREVRQRQQKQQSA